ncbi:MAG: hypothetical protein C0483_09965 [Pirellula sp.]|nr:hypothetical protein [Pirellula sp.]
MPAKLIVVEGAEAGSELWVEYEVLRFGSDPSCELVLADSGVEPHALTVRYGDGRYTVFNRSSAPLQLDAVTLAPSESGVWRSGKTLRFPNGSALKLETSGDGAPTRRPLPADPQPVREAVPVAGASPDDVAIGGGSPSEPKPEKSNTGAIIAGLVFAVAAVLILFSDEFLPSGPAAGEEKAPAPFSEVVSLLQKDPNCAPDLWIQLSKSYADAYRGDEVRSAAGYRRLRDRIVWEKNQLLTQGRPVPDALLEAESFVTQQITPGAY